MLMYKNIDDGDVRAVADTFRLLGDVTRLRILLCCLQKPVAVGAIADRLDLSPSLVSHHLRLLRGARMVRPDRHGKSVIYRAADDHVRTVLGDMVEHIGEIAPDDR
jgi:DNA-binding transcriptional ArsR family regulator